MSQPFRSRRRWQVAQADCFTALPKLDADGVDAVIAVPPYGIGVNGLEWDRPGKFDPNRGPVRLTRP